MTLNRNGTLKLIDSLQFAARHTSLSESEQKLLFKTYQNITLLAPDNSNAKLGKNSQYETDYVTYILYMSPHDTVFKFLSRSGTLCPMASNGCKRLCLSQGGRAKMDKSELMGVSGARLRKTTYYVLYRDAFILHLKREIDRIKKKLKTQGKRLALRLNGTTDVSWDSLIKVYPDVLFYDYSAVPKRAIKQSQYENYHVTFSRKESNDSTCLNMLHNGINVAIPFQADIYNSIGDTMVYQGETFKVVDGSAHDMRFLDPTDSKGYIIKLKEIKTKKSKNDTDGFIVRDLSQIETPTNILPLVS